MQAGPEDKLGNAPCNEYIPKSDDLLNMKVQREDPSKLGRPK